MKDELTTILDAMRAAQAELADYLVSADRNAELTIAKRQGHAVAARLGAPRRRAAKTVGRGELTRFAAKRLAKPTSYLQCRMKNPA